MSIQNFQSKDPFAAADFDEEDVGSSTEKFKSAKSAQAEVIHIRIQQRNGRKTLTTIQGLPKEFDPKKVLKAAKKEFACNGSVVEDEEYGSVIQLQGDQRNAIKKLLTDEGVADKDVKVHGF